MTVSQNYDSSIEIAKNINPGSSDVIIAVVDESIAIFDNVELIDSIYRDTNGKVIGKNVHDNCEYSDNVGNENLLCKNTSFQEHGTKSASLIAAKTNNNIGGAGTCNSCKIMPLGVYDTDEVTNTTTIAYLNNAFNFAIANGADIINNSYGGTSSSTTQSTAVQNAIDAGIFVVASSMNCGGGYGVEYLKIGKCYKPGTFNTPNCLNFSTTAAQVLYDNGCIIADSESYPASYPGVFSVSAYDQNGKNYQFNANSKVKISAPGIDLLITSRTGNTKCANKIGLPTTSDLCYYSGTSAAAPVVSGILGLVKSLRPYITPQNYTATDLGRGAKQFVYTENPTLIGKMGAGAINACGALLGTYQLSDGTCALCPIGKYCTDYYGVPVDCTATNYCLEGSNNQLICPAGFYCPGGITQKVTCPPNKYCLEAVAIASSCPVGSSSASGSDSPTDCIYPSITMTIKALLAGPYDLPTRKMNTDLRSRDLLPYSQPFNVAPFNYSGLEKIPNNSFTNLTDWILVQIKDPISNNVIWQKAALLRSEGFVVNPESLTT